MRQKAPSAIRCIKTVGQRVGIVEADSGQKAPSAIRCIKTSGEFAADVRGFYVRKHRAP